MKLFKKNKNKRNSGERFWDAVIAQVTDQSTVRPIDR